MSGRVPRELWPAYCLRTFASPTATEWLTMPALWREDMIAIAHAEDDRLKLKLKGT